MTDIVKVPRTKDVYDRPIRVRVNSATLKRLFRVMKRNRHSLSDAVRIGLELYEKKFKGKAAA